MQQTATQTGTRSRGFASMDSERQREIARKGGKAAHEKGTAHEFTPDEARAAGRKGGERVSADRHHMSRIGRLGGKSSAGRRQASRGGNGHPGTTSATPHSPEQGSGGGGASENGQNGDAREAADTAA